MERFIIEKQRSKNGDVLSSVALESSKSKNCAALKVGSQESNYVSELLYEAFVKEGKYGPVIS